MKHDWIFVYLTITVAAAVPAIGQTSEPTMPVPATIRAEGVPPVPASVRHGLARYQNIRSASFQDWSSDGQGMYVLTRFADVPQVHFVARPDGARTQLTFLAERVQGVWARPSSDQFLYQIDEGGAENSQLFLQSRKGGEPVRVTDGKSRNLHPKWSRGGDLLAWSSNARNGRDMDIWVGAPSDPHLARLLKEVNGDWTVNDWSPDGTKVAAVEFISINESYIHIIDVVTGKTATLTPRPSDKKRETIASSDPKWSKDGRSIYYLSDSAGEFQMLASRNLESGIVSDLSGSIPADIEEFDLSDDGQHIAVVANVAGQSQAWTMYVENQICGTPYAPSGVVSHLKFRPGSHEFAFSWSHPQSSADAYSRPGPGGQSDTLRWTNSETGGLDPQIFPTPELIEFKSFDGRNIPAFVYMPSPQRFPGPRPVLIDIHGGPEGQFRPGFLGGLNYLVAELGIAIIFPNVRGSSGYGKSYLKLDNGMKRDDSVRDIGALLDWIAGASALDKNRVAVIGGSYGGFMSLAVQTAYNDRIKAGIDIVGISNFVTFLKNTQGYRRDLRRAEYGDERDEAMRAYLERVSPLAQAQKIRTPILVVQGQNDPRVPISEAEQLVSALKKNGTTLWYMVGTNEGHGFAKKPNQDYLQAVEVMFLRRFLLGEPDPK
jgi:dipeptidyl aminopeptidase/acylaminoacyl peptidase